MTVSIDRIISHTSCKIGDTITYITKVTVSSGNIVYNLSFKDEFPSSNQEYVSTSATVDGLPALATVSNGTITFPTMPNITATHSDVTVTFSYSVTIVSTKQIPPYTEIQTSNGTASWQNTLSGTINSLSKSIDVNVVVPFLTGIKEQRNVTNDGIFTTSDISYNTNDTIEYKISIKNEGASPAFNIILTDKLNTLLSFDIESSSASIGSVVESSGVVKWSIPILNEGITANLTFRVTASSDVASNNLISNIASCIYSSNNNDLLDETYNFDLNTINLIAHNLTMTETESIVENNIDSSTAIANTNDTDTNNTDDTNIESTSTKTYESNNPDLNLYTTSPNLDTINVIPIEFTKSASINTAAIGSTITYTLTLNIPSGLEVYNLKIIEVIPPRQQYEDGSWSPGTPIISGNILTFDVGDGPFTGPLTLTYTFNTIVTSGLTVFPYIETQKNIANIQWDLTPSGPSSSITSTSVDVNVASPHITSLKEQRNVTKGGSFTTGPLSDTSNDDIIEYRITLNNDGENTAYNIITTDIIDNNLEYIGLVAPIPPGSVVSSVPLGTPDGTITWTESTLDAGSSISLTFQVKVLTDPSSGTDITNQSSTIYDTNDVNPLTLGPILTNKLSFNYGIPLISKTADDYSPIVGSIVTYTVSISIPENSIAYNVQASDVLPANQSYLPDSLTRNNIPIPSSTLSFPFEGTIDASSGTVTIVYTFQTIVEDATLPEEQQINTSTVIWDIDPSGTQGIPQTSSITLFATQLILDLLKEQRNYTEDPLGSFVNTDIQVKPGDIIQYRFIASNTDSTTTSYNVIVDDPINPLLQFDSIYSIDQGSLIVDSSYLTWYVGDIPPNTSYSAIVSFRVLSGAPGNIISNNSAGSFSTVNDSPIIYGPISFNHMYAILSSNNIINPIDNSKHKRSSGRKALRCLCSEHTEENTNKCLCSEHIEKNTNKCLCSEHIEESTNKDTDFWDPPITKSTCILTNKIYSQCQKRICFADLKIELPAGYVVDSIKFSTGVIVEDSLVITPIPNRPNFNRIRFSISVPYTAILSSDYNPNVVSKGVLPLYDIDTVLFMPNPRDEINFIIDLNTKSLLLLLDKNTGIFSVGIFNVISAVLKVQLFIPEYGFCPEPNECEEFPATSAYDLFEEIDSSEALKNLYPK
ncbi:hypothetical protein CLPU_18c00540 [Gottschalkia purinilytica]|uniref:DUF11 domain-containing protein n=1 Tax=Gottschalkia purinilytica TaxID=1503 RepID=A0A0L0W7C5_GOTPU|nr:DUF11 domain-containing protein [Gottschalkia purinilytica]KNF07372.1 hypothetical protein CLPU_18c00540 [Gottschalkia purinilytica]